MTNQTQQRKGQSPHWDEQERQLWWRTKLVLEFGRVAPGQEALLRAFQNAGWPRRLVDYLPAGAGNGRKWRLRQLVKKLNRNQNPLRLRFRMDGTGHGVCWEPA